MEVEEMGFIQITKSNIETEHIRCALGAKQYEHAVSEKKKWLTERMDEGLVFYRLDERAKIFIEYCLLKWLGFLLMHRIISILTVYGFQEDIKIMGMPSNC